jgi:hypothetical protein
MNQTQEQIQQEALEKLLDSGLLLEIDDKNVLDETLKKAASIITTPIPEKAEDKDKAFGEYRETMIKYGGTLSKIKFNFGLKESEYKLIRKIIFQELEYDRQDLFIALSVRDNFFDVVETAEWQKTKFKGGEDAVEIFKIDIHDITRISHLIGQYKIKGLNKVATSYAEVIRKIGDISKIFEHYNKLGEQMSEAGGNWIQNLEKEPVDETEEKVEVNGEERVLVDKKIQPKSKKSKSE